MTGTRILSLWLPHLAIDRARCERARLSSGRNGLPHATCLEHDDHQPLLALCPRARRAGLQPGMSSADAKHRVPGLVIHPADSELDRQFLETCVSWCERYTPFVAVDRSFPEEGGASLWLDISNSAHLAGGEASLLAGLLGQFRKMKLTARAAIANHPGLAWAACHFGHDEQQILATNGARVALARWPLEALRLKRADCDKLENAGIDRIEHLYALPRHAIAARFGDHVAIRLDQALGLLDEPIATDMPLPAQQAQMIFAEPVTSADALPRLIDHLLRQLSVGLEAAGLGARRLTLALYRVDNSTVTCTIDTDHPSRSLPGLSTLFSDRCENIDLGFGLERAILDAVEIEPLLPESIHWRGLGSHADEPLPDLAPAPVRRGHPERLERDVWSRTAQASRLNTRTLPLQRENGPPVLPVPGHQHGTALALAPADIEQPALQETLPRPLRLLRQPEPIEAIASLPDEPPVLFRWRQRLHKVTGARGPETVAPDWCLRQEEERPPSSQKHARRDDGKPSMRDYFAVEDSEGARFWLFREGRYGAASGTLPRWFLHGVFG